MLTLSGEPLGNAFLHGNTAHVVPVVPPPLHRTPPPATNSSTPETAQTQKHRYVFIEKPRKACGPLVSLPDPEPDQFERKGKAIVIARRGRRSNRRALFFVGDLEPLLLARRQTAGRSGGDGGLLRWIPISIIPVRITKRTKMQMWTRTQDLARGVVPTIVVTGPEAEPEMGIWTTITPKDVERAISVDR